MNKLTDVYYRLHNIKTKYVRWPFYTQIHKDEVKLLELNSQFKDAYKGERCFIFGNGPSLKELDFSRFSNEYTFTVNQLSRNPQFESLKTNFHFWADPVFFNIDLNKPEDIELLNVMKAVHSKDNSPKVFYPIDTLEFVKKYELDRCLDVHYFKSELHFLNNTNNLDYTKIVPAFGTVVQWCITMAIYMGFTEIYLLGCDNTGIINNIQSAMKVAVTEYNYQISENEQNRMERQLDNKRLYDFVSTYGEILLDYEYLFDYCVKHSIKLRNCTPQSAIDCIPKEDLKIVLER